MASLTRWPWIWAKCGRQWRSAKPGMLPFMGSQRVGHDLTTKKQPITTCLTGGVGDTIQGLRSIGRMWPIVLARGSRQAGQVIQSLWAWTPPETVIQGEVSLVSHEVNLKVTTEHQGQEKYYKALCTYLSKILPESLPTLPQACVCPGTEPDARTSPRRLSGWNMAGKIREVQNPWLQCNKWWKREGVESEVTFPVRGWEYRSTTSKQCVCVLLPGPSAVFAAESYFPSCVCHRCPWRSSTAHTSDPPRGWVPLSQAWHWALQLPPLTC